MGSVRGLEIPNDVRIGPSPRTRRLLLLPETTKPMMSVSLPTPETALAEKFAMRAYCCEAIENVNVEEVVPEPFFADIVTVKVPDEVAVPVIAPVAELSTRPGGRPLAV
jgi:hypothetical protein